MVNGIFFMEIGLVVRHANGLDARGATLDFVARRKKVSGCQ